MTSTVKVEGLIREIVNRDEDAGGDTEPKSSNRAKNCWFMAGAGHREEGSRAESDKVPTSRFSTVAAPERVRLSECQRSLTRITSTVKVEGLIREIVNRDEDAGGDTEPKSSNRAKNCWFMAGAGHREEGSRPAPRGLSLIRSRPLGCSTVAAPERDQRCSDTSGTRGTTRPLAIRADRMVERGRRRVDHGP